MKRTLLAVMGFMAVLFICEGVASAGTCLYLGDEAGHSDPSCQAGSNTFLGSATGYTNTSGTQNTFVGSGTGSQNSSGNYNTMVGHWTGFGNTTGNSNTFVGSGAAVGLKGSYNTIIGSLAGSDKISATGSNNTYVGYFAGYSATTAVDNVFIGSNAGYSATTAHYNTYVGQSAGYNATGDSNVFIGNGAGYNATGDNKLYIDNYINSGASPLIYGEFDNQTVKINGSLEVTDGIKFPDGNTQTYAITGMTAPKFTSMGDNAGTTGTDSVFVGYEAGQANNHTGIENSFLGSYSGNANTTGQRNTFIGYKAGYTNLIGSGNVFVGSMAGYNEKGDNRLHINNGLNDTPLIYGEFDNKTVQINGTVIMVKAVAVSDERLKKNIEPLKSSLGKVMNLNGVSYEWKAEENQGKGREIGLIAQDVEAVIPELVYTDSKGYKSLSYDKIVPVLVEAIKEQQQTIAEKSRTIDEQKSALEALTAKFEKLETKMNRLESKGMSAQK
jgi:hypothetical protein